MSENLTYSGTLQRRQDGSNALTTGGTLDLETGSTLTANGVTIVSDEIGVMRHAKIEIDADFDNSEQVTTFTLPAKAVVFNVVLDVTTADSSQTLDVGTATADSGDPNGYLDGVSVNGIAVVRGVLTAGAVTLGNLLIETVTDSNSDTLAAKIVDVASGGKRIAYTGSDTTNTMRGAIHIFYAEIV